MKKTVIFLMLTIAVVDDLIIEITYDIDDVKLPTNYVEY